MNLANREAEVLATIIERYIATAAPVCSASVARKSGLRLSPASMRNTMAELTEKGFLVQPHASAGRIPTARGFRLYLDALMETRPLSRDERTTILNDLSSQGFKISDILREASRMLSTHSRQVAVVLAPSRDEVKWHTIDFVKVGENLVLTVLVLEGGLVRNHVLSVETPVTQDELVRYSNYLNDYCRGLTLSQARIRVARELIATEAHLEELYTRALGLARLAFEHLDDEREVFINGTLNMLDQAEFTDHTRIRDMLALLEERTSILELLDKAILSDSVTVNFELEEQDATAAPLGCSMVCAPYGGLQQTVPGGVISVLGPLRMNYRQVLPVVDCISKTLTTLLQGRFGSDHSG
ncbi:heat-inducible transcriptional repressor HrcA [Oleidesulfovibrio sp.]|uniref:heat-inducible transcriptional repressor HrcA n=1 Tax=Oleidesulfovibrio sp. TaxID=2909707 RepID=UPI003A881B9A